MQHFPYFFKRLNIIVIDAKAMDDNNLYSHLMQNIPDGLVPADKNEQDEFRKWLKQ